VRQFLQYIAVAGIGTSVSRHMVISLKLYAFLTTSICDVTLIGISKHENQNMKIGISDKGS
jgi:hypothetical protein